MRNTVFLATFCDPVEHGVLFASAVESGMFNRLEEVVIMINILFLLVVTSEYGNIIPIEPLPYMP